MSGRAEALAVLLAPYADPEFEQIGRVAAVPPAVGEQALRLLLPEQVAIRCNGVQPPMSWLVRHAALLDAQLVGGLARGRAYVRFDGVQLGPAGARILAERLAVDWPATADAPGALESAVVEAWTSWTAREPSWTGTGADLLTGSLPSPASPVWGFWWD